jgi:hypothetical protein
MMLRETWQKQKWQIILASIGLVPAFIYFFYKCALDNSDTVDFKYLWLAGDLWRHGLNTYSPSFHESGQRIFQHSNRPVFFLYPPSWWPICRALAQLPYTTAGTVWRITSALLLLFSMAMLQLTIIKQSNSFSVIRNYIFIGYSLTMTATAIALSLGQTSLVVAFGVNCFVAAYVSGHRTLMGIALFSVLLKPSIGAFFFVFLVASPYWWPSLIVASMVSMLCALPAMVPFGIAETAIDFVKNLSHWAELRPNLPAETTGLRALLGSFFGITITPTWLYLFGLALAGRLGFCKSSCTSGLKQQSNMVRLCVLLPLSGLFVPLHTYDLTYQAPLILLSSAITGRLQIVIGAALLLVYRSNNLALAFGIANPNARYNPGSVIASLSLIVLAIAAAMALTGIVRHPVPRPGE